MYSMTNHKITVIALIVIISVLTAYTLISGNNALKEIKKLTLTIDQKADSLRAIQLKYDSLTAKNDDLFKELELTSQHLRNFEQEVDSVLALRMKNIADLNKSLDDIIKKQRDVAKINATDSGFRFQ